jgi:hypothetical protein
MLCNLQSCPFWNTEGCNYSDPSECDLAKIFPASASEKPYYQPALLYIKLSYLDEWRHIPEDEVYTIWTAYDFEQAVYAFRERHGSHGTLMVFATEDFIEWWIWGYVPIRETCKG